MLPFLFLGHGALALIALLFRRFEDPVRSAVVQYVCAAGGLLGLVLFFAPARGSGWRTTAMEPAPAAVSGIAVACAWLLVGVIERTRRAGRWDIAVLVGVAACSLCLFGANRWVVPGLLFWAVFAAALGVLAAGAGAGPLVSLTVFGATALLVAGLLTNLIQSQGWAMPVSLEGPSLWLVAAGAVLLSGAIPALGGWGLADSDAFAGMPLMVGGAFLMVAGPGGAQLPLVALGLVILALTSAAWALARKEVSSRFVKSWIVALMLGLTFVSPGPFVVAHAALAATAAASLLALWPLTMGRVQIERGLLVSFVSVTAGFDAIAAAAGTSFDRATATEAVARAAPWAAVSALLPVALAAGVTLGVRVGRRAEPDEYSVPAVLASWGLFLAGILLGLVPDVGGGQLGVLWLYVVALAAGVAAAWTAGRRWARAGIAASHATLEDREPFDPGVVAIPPRAARLSSGVALVLAAAAALAVLATTFQGLRLGFL